MRYSIFTAFIFSVFLSFGQMTPTLNDILIPMRDGKFLSADVYIPTGVDSSEVVLIQTPYNKNLFEWSLPMGVQQNLNGQPFIWVIVDWRGFYGSSAAAITQPNRGEDAYDVCEWITEQVWHKNRIGTWGPSALGGIQYNLIRENHPAHTCAVPLVANAHQSYDSYFENGVLEAARLEQLDLLGYGLSPVVLANPYYSTTWQFAESTTWFAPDIKIPTLQIGGWYDHNIDKMVDFYEASRLTADPSVQNEQWLLVGPWVHGGSGAAYVGSSIQGELTYPNAEFKSDTMAWDFLQYYLLDTPNNWMNTDKITYYETGLNQWATSNATNIEAPTTNDLYFNIANELVSGSQSGSSSMIVDPHNPSPTIGGAVLHNSLEQGPMDQISLEGRSDILTFSTDALSQDVSISGRVNVHVFVESDRPDADISVRLVDVYPDDRNMLITDGIARMRFRNGYTQADEVFMSPGMVYERTFELPFTNYTWLAGHKIKIYVGGNNAIRYDVNLQNGGTMYAAGDTNIANVVIHHDATYPSRITLPGDNNFLGSVEDNFETISVYPNPSSTSITVKSVTPIEFVTINDMNGRLVCESNSPILDVSNLSSGIYWIKVKTDGGYSRTKFVKN